MIRALRFSLLFLAVAATAVLGVDSAGAQDDADGAYVGGTTIVNNTVAPSPLVESDSQVRSDSQGIVRSDSQEQVASDSLAFTGSDVAGLVLIGGLATVLGFVVLTTRRRTATA